MQGFIITLLICSVTMSILALLYMTITPVVSRRYSAKGLYYAWLIIVIGLIIPFRPQFIDAIVQIDVSNGTAPSPISAGSGADFIIPDLSNGVMRPPVMDLPAYSPALPPMAASVSWWQIGFAVWLVGLITFLIFHAVRHYRFAMMMKRWGENVTDWRLTLFQNLKMEMGISKRINLYQCVSMDSPLLFGVVNPCILLPRAELDADELRFIFKHELIHFKRKDLYYKCLVLLATAVHWFNPFVYLIANAISTQCELSCDDEVVRGTDTDTRQQYSETIIGVIKYHTKLKPTLSTNFYGGKKGMKKRISSIMDTSKKRVGAFIISLALVATLSTGLVFAINAYANVPALTVEDVTPHNTQRAANTITADEAAQYAAQHIYEMFGVCLDGSVVQANYCNLNTQWVVTFVESSEAMAELWNFRITLDATDGDWVSVGKSGRGLNVTQPGDTRPIDRLFPQVDSNATVESWVEIDGQRIVSPHPGAMRPADRLFPQVDSNATVESWFEIDGQRIVVPQENIRFVQPFSDVDLDGWFNFNGR